MSENKPNNNLRSKIERLSEKLYSRTRYQAPADERESITPASGETAPSGWQSPPVDDLLMADRRAPEQYPLMRKIFVVALLFCICAALAAALIYFKGDNFISTKNLDIDVEGPVTVSAGSPVELQVTITNKNNAPLDTVNLKVIYPEGTRSAEDTTKSLTFTKEVLEALGAGDKVTRTEKAVFFGSEGEQKNVRVSVDYRVKGSNAIFTKEKVFELTIGSAPVSISVTRPDSVTSGEQFTAIVSVVANSEEILKDVVLRAEYPYGWSLKSASPPAVGDGKNAWPLGDLSPGDRKVITLNGMITGEDNDERTFRFFVGVGKGGGISLDTVLSQESVVVAIRRPSIDLSMKLNGDSGDTYSAPAGKQIQAVVSFKNNMSANFQNPQLEVKLSGAALDRGSVTAQNGGFYNSSSNSIFWNQSNSDNFSTISPGDTKTVSFSFSSLANLPAGSSNQKIDISASLTGRPQDSGSSITLSELRSVKIASEVALTSKSLYSRGPFTNTGLIPPKAEKETTYTVDLILGNTQNDITDAKVTGTLGANVKWTGQTSPSGAEVVYDDSTRTVTWNVGTLPSGAGFSTPGKEAFIKLSLTPSLGQVGAVPILLGSIVFTGTDTFTHNTVRLTNQAVTTRISSDPRYVQGDETVVK
ncbi:hypothetical protein KW796_02110 [Candidatus Parcubacteria bacterium]|nr:hypothetical protein [Candidatus Parcubacteria bacterium]